MTVDALPGHLTLISARWDDHPWQLSCATSTGATGTTAGWAGTVRGPGTSSNDQAGLYALSQGEEVVSNWFGQAQWSRPFLKAISAGQIRNPSDLAAAAGGGGQHHVTIHVQGDDSVLAQAIQVVVDQGISSYERAAQRTVRGGAYNKGLLAGVGS